MADRWMTRRIPARSQASNSAAGPSAWVAFVESLGESCKIPAQFTTASTPTRWGAQSSGRTARARSTEAHPSAGKARAGAPPRRPVAMMECPSLASAAATADPMNPVAPVKSTRNVHPPLRSGNAGSRQGFNVTLKLWLDQCYWSISRARARSFSVSLFNWPQAARMSRPRGVRTGLA